MTPRRILVTGGRGFVARHLVPRLAAAFPAAEILACDQTTLDVADAGAVAALVGRFRPEACMHLAAVAAVREAADDPHRAWRVNLHGTLAVAEALRAHAPDCVMMFSSSADIYGNSMRTGTPVDESAPPAPRNLYAATKAAADLALGAMAEHGLRAIRLRPFNHTGPGQSADFVVAAFARQVARVAAGRQEPVLRVGSLAPERDFLDVRDVCDAYVACVRNAERIAPGTILNLASGTPRRIGAILEDLLALAGVKARIEIAPALLRGTEMPRAVGNAAAARALLSWQPTTTWTQTLADVLADWRERVSAEAPSPTAS